MKTVARLFLMLIAVVAATTSYATDLSESSVMALMAQMDQAIHERDAEAVGKLVSPMVEMSGSVTSNGVRQPFHMNKSQYMQSLRMVWAQASEYSYERKNVKIRLAQGKAIVTATVIERMRIGTNHITSTSDESAEIALVNGKLQLTRVTANGFVQ